MATQYSYEDMYSSPEIEYQAEELKKRLKYSMANFAQVRFRRAMKMQMALIEDAE